MATRDPVERKQEILKCAESLFVTKGYSKTTIMDILNETGIAKGTLYYYFSSKEEIMVSIIDQKVQLAVDRGKKIALNENLSVYEKIFYAIQLQGSEDDKAKAVLTQQFHEPENAEMHQKSIQQTIKSFAPVLTTIIEQGIDEGLFRVEYPLETVEFILTSIVTLFDEGLFQWSPEEKESRFKALVIILNRIFGAEEGSFDFILQLVK